MSNAGTSRAASAASVPVETRRTHRVGRKCTTAAEIAIETIGTATAYTIRSISVDPQNATATMPAKIEAVRSAATTPPASLHALPARRRTTINDDASAVAATPTDESEHSDDPALSAVEIGAHDPAAGLLVGHCLEQGPCRADDGDLAEDRASSRFVAPTAWRRSEARHRPEPHSRGAPRSRA